MGPTVWITRRAGSCPAVVATASPVGRPSRSDPARKARHAARISGPPARWMAPSTPPPPSSDELAAFTMASTACVVMSPRTIWISGTVTSVHAMPAERAYLERLRRARDQMSAQGVDVLLVSVGADLPYLTGYEAMPLERLPMLVLPRAGEAT